jgi:hypothetical protein
VTEARRAARDALAHGIERAGARSHFRSIGIHADRLSGADRRHRLDVDRDDAVQREPPRALGCGTRRRRGGGGVASPFNTIAVSDNQSQATPGVRALLASRAACRCARRPLDPDSELPDEGLRRWRPRCRTSSLADEFNALARARVPAVLTWAYQGTWLRTTARAGDADRADGTVRQAARCTRVCRLASDALRGYWKIG